LTERGKIIIAIILVALIFVLPALILAVKAWNSSPPPPDIPSQDVQPDDSPPKISDGPLPDGSGFNPTDPVENGEQGSFDPPVDPPYEPPAFGPVSIDLTAGIMLFKFSPDHQDAIDEETFKMIGDFLRSPKNTAASRIAVEMPKLPEDDTSNLIAVITDVFASHNVSLEKLAFASLQSANTDGLLEVRLLFFTESYQK